MSDHSNISCQGDRQNRTVFKDDPKLLDDLRNHRLHDSYKLIKRLETAKKTLPLATDQDAGGDNNAEALLDTLVAIYYTTADSVKISRNVEKLWQSYLGKYSGYIYTRLEENVLATFRSDRVDAHSIAKVSVLFEQNKTVQLVVKRNLAAATAWLARHLASLIELPPLALTQTQAQCLYSLVKISLQLFQVCPSEFAPAIWSLEPIVPEIQASPGYRGAQASVGLRLEPVRVVVESLIHVLAVKGYHIDCVLLSGTAVTLMLNTAPDPDTAVRCYHMLLQLTLSNDSRFKFDSIRNLQDSIDTVSTVDQLKQLDDVTIDTMGPVALIRGVVVCGSTELLCCQVNERIGEKPDCDNKPACDVDNEKSVKSNINSNTDHTFYILFCYIKKLCKGDITLHYHAFHILLLWYSRINKLTSEVESSLVETYSPSVLKNTQELVMLNWDSPVEDVPDIVVDIFNNMMSLWTRVKARMPDFSTDILDVLVKAGWHVKGKYRILAALLKHLDASQVSTVCSGIQPQLLRCLATNHLASSATAVYKAFLTQLGGNSSQAVARWRSVWLETVESGLISENILLRHNTSLHWVPATLKLVPGSVVCIQDDLSHQLEGGAGQGGARTRLLHAWVVVTGVIRNLTGAVDLSDPHVREALFSSDDDVRSEAIALVCNTLKKSECLSDLEASLLCETLPYNIKIDSAPFRQHLGSSIRKLLVRLRDSCISLLKAPAENKTKLDCALEFVDWLHSLCIGYLTPGACYQRRKGSLDLLHVIHDALIYHPAGRHRKGFTPETAMRLMDYAVSKGHWAFFSTHNLHTILLCLLDGADEIQTSALQLLMGNPSWPLKENVGTPDSLCCHLMSAALQLCNSPKGHESQSGAVLCKLVFQKFVLVGNLSINFGECEENGSYAVAASGCQSDAAAQFLCSLLKEVQKSLAEAERNLVIASKKYPVHGLVAALCQCLTDSEALWSGQNSDTVVVGLEFIASCQGIIDKMMAVMSSVAGQEACPSFAEIGMALENLLLEHQPEYTESTALSPEYQYLLSWCWNNIKTSCVSLGEMMWTMVSYKLPLSPELTNSISDTFLAVLTKCRHKGVIEGCRSAFVRFCSALFRSEDEALHKIPKQILQQVLTSLQSEELKSSVTRRSAGLPIILQAILTSEKIVKKKVLLSMAVSELFEICELPLDLDPGVTDLPQVHGLNIINSLFSDTSLAAGLTGHVGRATVLVIQQFGSPSWAVRNAATRFFSTLVTRIFGQKKTGGVDENMLCNSVSFLEFSSYYPELPPFLLGVLREASGRDVANIADIHPSLFPVLTLLSFLRPVDKQEEEVKSMLAEFGSQVHMFVHSPVYQLRHLVAPAFVAMVTMAAMATMTVTTIQNIPTCSSSRSVSLNFIHGNLLVVNKLLDYISDEEDLATLLGLLQERSWLLGVRHGMVTSLYIRIVRRFRQKNANLCVDTGFVQRLLEACCHADMLVGDGVFKTEAVEFLFHTIATQGRQNDPANINYPGNMIEKLLSSQSLETRKACLLKMESELDTNSSWRPNCLSILCKSLQNETYPPSISMTLYMINRLYLESRTMLPSDLDQLRDWFKNDLPKHRKCVSLVAASLPVQGILIKDMFQNNKRELQGQTSEWCRSVQESSLATNETQRLSAAFALRVVGDCVFLAGIDGQAGLSDCIVSLLSAGLTLIQDEDTEIRAEACKFVSSLQWSDRKIQYGNVHSNVCFELFLDYIASNFWQVPQCVRCLGGLLYRHGNLATVLHDKTTTRFQQLFDQEDNSFFAERLYNAISFHQALKEMVARCRSAGCNVVMEVILEWTQIVQDVDILKQTLQSIRQGCLINVCCDNAILASISGLLLMANLIAMATNQAEGQTLRSKMNSIMKENKLPPGFLQAVKEAVALC